MSTQIDSADINFDQLSKEIFDEQNRIRANPQCYIEKWTRAKKFFKDKIFRHPAEIPIETYEGAAGVDEAISFLENQKPLPKWIKSDELSNAAKLHANDIGSKGWSSHEGSNGEGISERIERFIEWDGAVAENLDFCYKYAENIIMNLIIDDGSSDRHQRNNLFDPDFQFVGIGCAKHKTFKMCTVINYAKGLHAKGEEPKDVINSVRDYIDKTMGKSKEGEKNAFQIDDPDAPDNTVSVKMVKLKKTIQGKERNITRKIYVLNDGKQHIVEIEERD